MARKVASRDCRRALPRRTRVTLTRRGDGRDTDDAGGQSDCRDNDGRADAGTGRSHARGGGGGTHTSSGGTSSGGTSSGGTGTGGTSRACTRRGGARARRTQGRCCRRGRDADGGDRAGRHGNRGARGHNSARVPHTSKTINSPSQTGERETPLGTGRRRADARAGL